MDPRVQGYVARLGEMLPFQRELELRKAPKNVARKARLLLMSVEEREAWAAANPVDAERMKKAHERRSRRAIAKASA